MFTKCCFCTLLLTSGVCAPVLRRASFLSGHWSQAAGTWLSLLTPALGCPRELFSPWLLVTLFSFGIFINSQTSFLWMTSRPFSGAPHLFRPQGGKQCWPHLGGTGRRRPGHREVRCRIQVTWQAVADPGEGPRASPVQCSSQPFTCFFFLLSNRSEGYNSGSTLMSYEFFSSKAMWGTSLLVPWLRTCLPSNARHEGSIPGWDPTCHGATKPAHCNCWARASCLERSPCLQQRAHRLQLRPNTAK